MKSKAPMRGCAAARRGATRFVAVIAAVLVASLFALPALASSRDGNGDRISDRWEARYDLSLNKNQAPRDQDKDGVKNLAEYKDGTNPREADTDADGTTDGTDTDPCTHDGTDDTSGTGTTTTSSAPRHP
jgi:hypothetical protein